MNSMKVLSEASVSSSAEEATTIFPGVITTFKPMLYVSPRKFYFFCPGKIEQTHKAWHRDTSMTFNIDGITHDKPGNLDRDNILGYNQKFQYTAQFISGTTPVGTIYASAPSTMNRETKVTKGFTFQIEGNITGGLLSKDGLKGEASIKPSWKWESKKEYSVNDYECANISGGNRAGWKWEFRRPKDGSQGWRGVWLEDVPRA